MDDPQHDSPPSTRDGTGGPILRPGDTCWRVERAARMAVIVDAADYFRHLRTALAGAERAIYLVGWDFDLRLEMVPGESDHEGNAPDGMPNRLGPFLEHVVATNPDVRLRILKWDGAMIAEIAQQAVETLRLKLASDRISFALDSHHPVGATHHQKVVVIDDRFAFCGGIDVTGGRWDTREHVPDDPRRVMPDGTPHKPWHDVTTALEGPIAAALGDLARNRWRSATGEDLPAPDAAGPPPWPDGLAPEIEDVPVAIARTHPRYHGEPLVNEIERLYLAAIGAAERTIYIENQYLAGGTISEALEARLAEPGGPEVVIVNPRNAQGFLEDEAMHSIRSRTIERLREGAERGGAGTDGAGRLAVFYPADAEGRPIYVHAKVLIVDNRLVRIGSSNIDNRSMGYDTECDVAVEGAGEGTEGEDDAVAGFARSLRHSLAAEHMGCEPDAVAEAARRHGSLIAAIEALNPPGGRGLRPIEPEPLDPLERALADSRLFDPRTWPREQPQPVETVRHAARRAVAPYHVEAVGAGAVLLGVGALALGAWGALALARSLRGPDGDERDMAGARSDFPAPGIVTERTVRPSPARTRPDDHRG